MSGYGKYIGMILVGVGLCFSIGVGAYFWSGYQTHAVTQPGALLGFILFALIPFLGLTSVGLYLFFSGRAEQRTLSRIEQKEYLLGLIKAHGKISLKEIMAQMNLRPQEVSAFIYELVQMGLFAGYINWKNETFFSQDASALELQKNCPQCGAIRELAGKGAILCSHCGAESFLPK